MRKFIALIAGASLVALFGLADVALAGNKDEAEKDGGDKPLAENYNSSRSNVSSKKDPDDGGGADDVPKGTGDPMKGLLGGTGTPCKPCDVPFGGTVNTGGDDDQEGVEATSEEKKKDGDG